VPPSPGPELPGDYNLDDIVDAADYIVWRMTEGNTVSAFSGADGNGDTMVNNDDYVIWTANFGNVAPPGSGSAGISADSNFEPFEANHDAFAGFESQPRVTDTRATMPARDDANRAVPPNLALLLVIDAAFAQSEDEVADVDASNEASRIDAAASDGLFDLAIVGRAIDRLRDTF
jgi:hypothetical protein